MLHTKVIIRIIIKALKIVFTLNERHKYGVKPITVVFITVIEINEVMISKTVEKVRQIKVKSPISCLFPVASFRKYLL